MPRRTLELDLAELVPGSEILVKNEQGRPVARGVLRNDRLSLLGPNGEYIPLHGHDTWTVVVVKPAKSR
jgi:hypothetical protein